MFNTLKAPVLGVVEKMRYLDLPDGSRMEYFGTGGGEKLAISNDKAFLGTIPIDLSVLMVAKRQTDRLIRSRSPDRKGPLATIAREVVFKLSIIVMAE